MINPWGELHTLIIYVLFGYTLLLPLLLLATRLFAINSPLQRMRLYLLALLTPPLAFALYHTLLVKRCESGLTPLWADNGFHLLCLISENILLIIMPLTGFVLLLGLLKAIAAIIMTRRLRREDLPINRSGSLRINKILASLCRSMKLEVPVIIFSGRKGFAAFTAGFFKPFLVINPTVAAKLTDQELTVLLSHELVHIDQRDNLKSWLLHLVRDLTFINPVSTILLNRYLLEKEALCDRKAAQIIGFAPVDYAAALLKIWRSILDQPTRTFGLVSAFKGNGRGLERRVSALISKKADEKGFSSFYVAIIGGLLFSLTLLFLGLVC